MFKFSLIIPHYNVPELLIRCLRTIPSRTDLQIIVVDDASNSDCVDKIKKVQNEFENVEFIYSSPNHGGGYVRNIGLKHAVGDYVFFADADDFFTPCLNQFLDDISEQDEDIIFFNAISLDTYSYSYTYRCWHLNRWMNMHKRNPMKAEFALRYKFGEPWCKVIKRDLIEQNGICYDEIRMHDDTRFSYLVGFFAKKIVVDQRAVYCVTDRCGSVSKTFSPERLFERTQVFATANKFFKQNGIRCFDERAIRPIFMFLLKFDLKNFSICKKILIESGMSPLHVFVKILFYPFYALQKACVSMSQYSMRLFG